MKGIHWWQMNSPDKGPVTWKKYPFNDVILLHHSNKDISFFSFRYNSSSITNSSWWPLFPSRSSVFIYIYTYIYIHIFIYMQFLYFYLYEFCFLWFTNCVLLSDDNSLIPGCLWLLALVLNTTLVLGFWCTTIPSFRISVSTWCHRTPLCHI